ncbi:MAG: hypothetical protein IAE85_19585 [Anaerolinea sp.]|nr:hypothetical protein [Anaerolinea sp.]
MKLAQHLKPTLPRPWLLALAGVMWTAVGVMLDRYAFIWLTRPPSLAHAGLGLAGVAAAVPIYRLGFRTLARQNIERIRQLQERPCLFSFLAWKSYATVAVMISTGLFLRHSAIPKPYLAILYAAIGGGLFLSSFVYYGHLYRLANRHPYSKKGVTPP